MGGLALGLYEAPYKGTLGDRTAYVNTYEAMTISSILSALVVLVVTCADVEDIKNYTFLVS